MTYWKLLLPLGLLILFFSCQDKEAKVTEAKPEQATAPKSVKTAGKIFNLVGSAHSGISFSNELIETPERSANFNDYHYNGSGVVVIDINNDNLQDLFFTGNDVSNRIYLNKGGLQFEDITTKSGLESKRWSTGATVVDINNDGYLDLYVCNSDPALNLENQTNQLFINNKDNTFTEAAAKYGIDNQSKSTQASFFDYDKDGDLDLFVMNHTWHLGYDLANKWVDKMKSLSKREHDLQCSALYRNNGNGSFTNISEEAGILKPGFGLGLITADLNEDGYIDIYVANDFFVPDFMFINNSGQKFEDKINTRMGHTSYYSMGADAADFNNDGILDIAVVDMTPSDHVRNKTLMASMDVDAFRYLTGNLKYVPQYMFNSMQVNIGRGVFSEIGAMSNTSQTDWSWANLFADFNNDGWKDYFVSNGYKRDTKNNDWRNKRREAVAANGGKLSKQQLYDYLLTAESNPVLNYMYQNNGDYTFTNVAKDWGFSESSFSNGTAYADLDNDGDLDLVMNNIDKEAFLYENKSSQNNYLRIRLMDSQHKGRHHNAKVKIVDGNEIQFSEFYLSHGYQSSMEPYVHFGVGDKANVSLLEIEWIDGSVSKFQNVKTNSVQNIDYVSAIKAAKNKPAPNPNFLDITNFQNGVNYKHVENKYDDFATEILLPHRQSTLGPFLSTGDVNADGLEDFYIGGSLDEEGSLYMQQANGKFLKAVIPDFAKHAAFEDMGSVMIDIDNDNDLDLYVTSGGGGEIQSSKLLEDRLYLNNGAGMFTYNGAAVAPIQESTSVVKAMDYDKDGDLDLFVGGRTNPGSYPLPPSSFLLRNDNGKFIDVTKENADALVNIGMVTGMEWIDIEMDGDMDMAIVGEWMPLTILKNTNGHFKKSDKLSGSKTEGWWYSLAKGDIDNDGDDDLIAGNIGSNNKFHFTEKKPLHVYANDFDDNGTLDIVLSKKYKQMDVPVRGKECSSEQMPFISEKFPTYLQFSTSSIEDIYGADKIKEATHLSTYNSKSVAFKNDGGIFKMIPLPPEAQFAPINGIVINDIDKDGNQDVLVVGNNFYTEPETPQYDAGKGLFLSGNGDGTFNTSIQIEKTGFFVPEDARDIKMVPFTQNKMPGYIVSSNNNKLKFFTSRY